MNLGDITVGKNELIKTAIRVGNSAGVLLPKPFLGSEVKITILNKPLNIKKDVLKILSSYLDELAGIYIIASSEKLIEILAISSTLKKIIHSGKYKLSLVPLKTVKEDLKENERLKERLKKAKVIMNRGLLEELQEL